MFAHDATPVQIGVGCGDPNSVCKGSTVHFWGGNRIRGNSGKQEGARHLDTISTAQVSQETAMKFVSIPQVGNLGPASHISYLSLACGHALSGTLTSQTVDIRIFVAHPRKYESKMTKIIVPISMDGLECSAVPLSAAVPASPFSSRRVGLAASSRPPLRFLFPLSVRRVRPPSASVRQTDIWRSCAIVLLAFPSSLSASLTRLLHFFARPKAETGHLGPPSLTRAQSPAL